LQRSHDMFLSKLRLIHLTQEYQNPYKKQEFNPTTATKNSCREKTSEFIAGYI